MFNLGYSEHLFILPILIPLLAAPLCLILGKIKIGDTPLAWVLATVASAASLMYSIDILNYIMHKGPVSYAMGDWPAPWGIEVRLDAASALILLAVTGISTAVLVFARLSILDEVSKNKQSLFYTAYLLCLCGLSGILSTGDAFNLFVFLEISSLATYTLVSFSRDRHCLTAAFRYLIMGTLGATFILIGVGMLYMKTGTLNMLDLAVQIQQYDSSRTINTGLAFIMVGSGIKLALFPLHAWLPPAYTSAPSAATAFLAGTATKVSAYVMLRFIFTIFGAEHVFVDMGMDLILLALAVFAIFKCSFMATVQHNAKTLLAYSSVAQIGYIVLGITLLNTQGLTASLLHIFNHALMKGALFLALGAIVYRVGSVEIKAFAGLGKKMPFTMAAFTLGGLSLIGVPLTVGFVSKWYLVSAALEVGYWHIAALVLLGSLFAIAYVGRIIEAAYFGSADEEQESQSTKTIKEAPIGMLIPIWALVIANIYFGIDTSLTVGAAEAAAQSLFLDSTNISEGFSGQAANTGAIQ